MLNFIVLGYNYEHTKCFKFNQFFHSCCVIDYSRQPKYITAHNISRYNAQIRHILLYNDRNRASYIFETESVQVSIKFNFRERKRYNLLKLSNYYSYHIHVHNFYLVYYNLHKISLHNL